ncbi:MAG: hypothetical protein F6J92_37330 [Symploca sp. SIO1A3]|nr:hypothetical protein [Symploca sp. SIO1A3]
MEQGNSEVNASQTLLEKVLEGKDSEFRARVLNLVVGTGLTPNDPVFLMLIATGRLEVLLEDSPLALERLFQSWTRELLRSMELVETTTVERQKEAIAKAAGELIRQHEGVEAKRFFTSVVPAAAVLLGAIALGVLMGVTVPPWLAGEPDPTGPRQLTLKEAEALNWATSKEGQFARHLTQWNAGYLDGLQCAKDVKRLGVELTLDGRRAKEGYCLLWVVPPNQRRFD